MNASLARPRANPVATNLRFLLFGRFLPATFFAFLGYIQLTGLVAQLNDPRHPVTVLYVLSRPLPTFLYLLFCVIPVFIYVSRPPARARDPRVLPRALGLVGTTMLLAVGAARIDQLYTAPGWLGGVSTVLSTAAFGFMVYGLLYLRRSLSLMPEARRLVTGGPYRVVRHPLYSAEMLAAFASVLVNPYLVAVVTLLPFFVIQVMRSRYEERLLSSVFPGYAAYAAGTRRMIPFTW